jgi:hypothetical protein
MGGDLVVDSVLGQGSTFTLTLPRSKPAPVEIVSSPDTLPAPRDTTLASH